MKALGLRCVHGDGDASNTDKQDRGDECPTISTEAADAPQASGLGGGRSQLPHSAWMTWNQIRSEIRGPLGSAARNERSVGSTGGSASADAPDEIVDVLGHPVRRSGACVNPWTEWALAAAAVLDLQGPVRPSALGRR
jgi:hypothetical protein